uniref:Uncharacterized protein n=1 Tax=Arundo donax TaxID=35708 RepID=A0A0A9EVU3_ARUDO
MYMGSTLLQSAKPSDSSRNSRALPLSHLMVGRTSNTILPCVSRSFGYSLITPFTVSASSTHLFSSTHLKWTETQNLLFSTFAPGMHCVSSTKRSCTCSIMGRNSLAGWKRTPLALAFACREETLAGPLMSMPWLPA